MCLCLLVLLKKKKKKFFLPNQSSLLRTVSTDHFILTSLDFGILPTFLGSVCYRSEVSPVLWPLIGQIGVFVNSDFFRGRESMILAENHVWIYSKIYEIEVWVTWMCSFADLNQDWCALWCCRCALGYSNPGLKKKSWGARTWFPFLLFFIGFFLK